MFIFKDEDSTQEEDEDEEAQFQGQERSVSEGGGWVLWKRKGKLVS